MSEVIIAGPEGRLEGRYHQQESQHAPVVLVLHPHPLFGGTMNNKVVYRLYQSFVDLGFTALRFNFRGVGKSQGKYGDGIGELCDAATALDWLQRANPDAKTCFIAGFSFGAWISLQLLMRRPEIEGFVAVSPPANLYDFTFLSPCPASGLVTMGDKDDVVQEEAVAKLMARLTTQPGAKTSYHVVPGADHYYRNDLDTLTGVVQQYVKTQLAVASEKRRIRPDRKRRQLPRE